jgi:predicted transcriptional regulator of viral defense system
MINFSLYQRPKYSVLRALAEALAAENRRVLADWRAVLLLRRASISLPPERRRWEHTPTSVAEVRPILKRLAKKGDLEPIPGLSHLYVVTLPYASTSAVEESEVLMELHPFAAISHQSAMVFHQMTDALPKETHAVIPDQGSGGMLPLGTTPEDWEGLVLVRGRVADKIFNHPVKWHRLSAERLFGSREYSPHGYPVRVTTPERTLLDGLLQPEWCGGFESVLKAWADYRDLINVDEVVTYVNLFDIGVLRQRAGFVLEELGLSNPAVREWPEKAKRGGSSKLLGSAPFAPTFSERWKLSINAPVGVLHEAAG